MKGANDFHEICQELCCLANGIFIMALSNHCGTFYVSSTFNSRFSWMPTTDECLKFSKKHFSLSIILVTTLPLGETQKNILHGDFGDFRNPAFLLPQCMVLKKLSKVPWARWESNPRLLDEAESHITVPRKSRI